MSVLYKPGERVAGSRLTVIKEATPRKSKHYFLCQCDCGSKPKEIEYTSLRSGLTKSCGCLRKKAVREKVALEGQKKEKKKKRRNNSVDLNGISYNSPVGKYKVILVFDGKQFYGGDYDTIEEALAAKKALEMNEENLS